MTDRPRRWPSCRHRHPARERPRHLHGADQGALSLPVELGFLPDRARPAPLRRGPRLDRDRDAVRPPVAGRHGAAHRLPRRRRGLFPGAATSGRTGRPDADLRHHPAAGRRLRAAPALGAAPRPGLRRRPRARALLPEGRRLAPLVLSPTATRTARGWSRSSIPGSRAATTPSTGTRPFERVPTEGVAPYTRRDTQHADPAHRPTKAQYDRYLWLVEHFRCARLGQCQAARRLALPGGRSRLQRHPDPRLRRSRRARRRARARPASPRRTARFAARGPARRWRALWSDAHGQYLCRDRITGALIDSASVGGLLPAFAAHPAPSAPRRSPATIDAAGGARPATSCRATTPPTRASMPSATGAGRSGWW